VVQSDKLLATSLGEEQGEVAAVVAVAAEE